MRRLTPDEATLNRLRHQAEESARPDLLRRVANVFEQAGRIDGAAALRRKAKMYEEVWERLTRVEGGE